MDLQHSFTVPAPIDRAWETLLDVEGIAPCFPGATLTGVDGEEFAGLVKVKLGPVSLQYAGKGRFLEKDAVNHTVRIEAQGSDKRGNGTAGASVVARLEADGEARTRVVVDSVLKITGRPAQFGRGVIQDVGAKIIEQFATCLAQRMTDAGPSGAGPSGGGASGAANNPDAVTPSRNDPALRTVQELGAAQGPVAAAAAEPVGEPADTAVRAAASSSATAGSGAVIRNGTPRPAATPPAPPRAEPVELDLNSVVLPALARRYGVPAAAAVLVLAILWLLGRRRR